MSTFSRDLASASAWLSLFSGCLSAVSLSTLAARAGLRGQAWQTDENWWMLAWLLCLGGALFAGYCSVVLLIRLHLVHNAFVRAFCFCKRSCHRFLGTGDRYTVFNLRALLVLIGIVAAGCGWFVRQQHFVAERERVIAALRIPNNAAMPREYVMFPCTDSLWGEEIRRDIPLVWRLLGAQQVWRITLHEANHTMDDVEYFARIFPEAEIYFERPDAKDFVVQSPVELRYAKH